MREELDKLLCEKYPAMMVNRNGAVTETCMCWGFECGDGWFNILNQLMGNIQHHIDWKNKQRDLIIRFNNIKQAGQSGNAELFADLMAEEYGDKGLGEEYVKQRAETFMREPLQPVPEEIKQVTVDQVKEKFGTLRFYYTGGDEYIRGMVTMAESMSGTTCESCGNPGERTGGGWIKTTCKPCEDNRAALYAAEMAKTTKKENQNEINYQFIGEDTGHHD